MLQKDHLMRMIQQFNNVMATVLALKRDGRMQEAIREINQMSERLVSGGAERPADLSAEELLDRLKDDGRLDAQRAMMMADLLAEESDIHLLEERDPEAGQSAARSISLRLAAFETDPSKLPADFFERVDYLLPRLVGIQPPRFLMWQLFRFFEATARFDQAENLLFKLARAGAEGVQAEGVAFYDRLESRPDNELEKGNLPRDEIEQGRADFAALFTTV